MELAPRRLATERKTRPAGVKPAAAEKDGMTADEAIVNLRRKIGLRLKSGPGGLMRCWLQFRNRSGASLEGISYAEFRQGLKNYDVVVTDAVGREVFGRMDASGDGYIQITEFIDHVMGRWPADTNTIVDSHKSMGHGANLDVSALNLTADEAIVHLRRKIGQRLKSGPYGLQRCWMQFRERSGGTKEGITYPEFKQGLKNYDLLLEERVYREIFERMDKSGDGHIQITEFIDHVMGRWSSDTNALKLQDGARPGTSLPSLKPIMSRDLARMRGVDHSLAGGIAAKMPASPKAVVALHRALHAADKGHKGSLTCGGAFAKVLARHGVVLTEAELVYVAETMRCAPPKPDKRRPETRGADADHGGVALPQARPSAGSTPSSKVRGGDRDERWSGDDALSLTSRRVDLTSRLSTPLPPKPSTRAMARHASAPDLGATAHVPINYGAFVRQFRQK